MAYVRWDLCFFRSHPKDHPNLVTSFSKSGVLGVILNWIHTGMQMYQPIIKSNNKKLIYHPIVRKSSADSMTYIQQGSDVIILLHMRLRHHILWCGCHVYRLEKLKLAIIHVDLEIDRLWCSMFPNSCLLYNAQSIYPSFIYKLIIC